MSHPLTEPVERSIGDVMADVAGNVEQLVRTEMELAKATALQGIKGLARGSALLAGGALMATLAVMLLLLGAVARLSETMAAWQATLLVAGGTALLSALLIGIGVSALRGHADPLDT